ncbi:MAG: hypothetical protein PHU40_06665 [Sulfurimonas sp.]|nr:hypothetical protein [Sulfurimonas sp.]
MYITINRKPTKEEISTFNIKVSEEDAIIDYRIELDSLDQTTTKVLCESYNINPEKIENITKIVLFYHNEV